MKNRYSNCYLLRNREDGEVIIYTFSTDEADIMMRDVSKIICFADCDDTFEIISIIYHGREVTYGGWCPGMKYQYYYTKTGDLAWEECFPMWDH